MRESHITKTLPLFVTTVFLLFSLLSNDKSNVGVEKLLPLSFGFKINNSKIKRSVEMTTYTATVDGESKYFYCLICNTYYIPNYADPVIVEKYLTTFEACMNLESHPREKEHFKNEYFPFCKQCLLMVANLNKLQTEIDSLRLKVLKNTWNLTVLILESYNKSLFDSKRISSATTVTSSHLAKIREQVCKRYQVHIKLRHVKKLSDSTHDVCIEQGETVDDLLGDDRTGAVAESYSEGLKEKVPRTLVTETGNNKSLNNNEFSFSKSTEDFKCASSEYTSKNENEAMQHARLARSEPTGAFKFKTCGKKFKNGKNLSIQANAHELSSGKFICNFCSKGFKHASSMYFHQRSHHKDNTKKYPCNECSKTFFKKAALDLHAVSHSKEKRFQCSHCGLKFARQNAWRVHTQVNQNKYAGSFSCTLCNALFSHRCALSNHAIKIHDVSIKRGAGNSNPLENTVTLIGEGCRASFPEGTSSCSIPSENLDRTNKETTSHYLRINSKNNKVQQVAHDTFNYGESFQFKKQNEEYHCCTCDYRSAKKVNMMNHIRVGHLYADRFVCECCGKTFRQLSDLRKHQKIHVTDCNYMCEVCGSKFKTSDGLRSHKRIHVGKTGNHFECEVCKKKYQYKKTLEEHITQHRSETEKLFECPECNKRFCNKRSRNFHLNSHRKKGDKQFSCTLCKTKFSYICSLKRHLKIFHEADSQDVK